MGKRRDRRHAVLGGGGRRMKLDLQSNDEHEVATPEEMNMSMSATVEEGGEKAGVESDERLSPHSLPGPVQVDPLSLLGQYSDEDEEEEKVLANGSIGGVPAVAVGGQVDEQVAVFLADLETSGLLKDEVACLENGTESEGAQQPKLPQDVGTNEMETPCEWEAVLHKETSEYYYWNKVTGETTWEKPAAYAFQETEVSKESNFQDGLRKDDKQVTEDQNPALETLAEDGVSTIDDAAVEDAENNMAPEEQPVVVCVESSQLRDEERSSEESGEQDGGRDADDGKQSDDQLEANDDQLEANDDQLEAKGDQLEGKDDQFEAKDDQLEAKEIVELKDSSEVNGSEDNLEIRRDPEASVSPSVAEPVGEEEHQDEPSMSMNIAENGEDAEDLAVELNTSTGMEDHPAARERADGTGLETSDTTNVPEQPKRYDYHRMLERGEVLASKFKLLAGEALRSLSLKVRLAVEADVRLSDCKAMAMHDVVDDRFWEHMDSHIRRLEALLLVEQEATPLEAGPQIVTSSDANRNHSDADVHEPQSSQHQPAAVPERLEVETTAQLRIDDEDMDVDMDVDMETEDVCTARSVDHDAASSLPLPYVYEAAAPQPVMYTSAQALHPLSEAPLFPVAPLFPSVAPIFPSVVPVFPTIPTSFPVPPADSWVPPPPPEDDWAPPPLPDQEAPPPPPPDEDEPPLASTAVEPVYFVPAASFGVHYPVVTDQFSNVVAVNDVDSSKFAVVDADAGSVHVNGNALPPSVVSSGAAETTTKKGSKVVRNKKRPHSTVVGASLKSNKKVSSLVNKWLAAQEELHSSDEEEEDNDIFDIEALEKKRQKEIEEWRHQTLASGGALENANFQPLGTLDWRERVKRAKREASKLAAKQEKEKDAKLQESKQEPADEGNLDTEKVTSTTPPKRPDLKELNKDLPSGWQAFWDAESCEVYYGNLATSETSWDRPV